MQLRKITIANKAPFEVLGKFQAIVMKKVIRFFAEIIENYLNGVLLRSQGRIFLFETCSRLPKNSDTYSCTLLFVEMVATH